MGGGGREGGGLFSYEASFFMQVNFKSEIPDRCRKFRTYLL